MDKILSSPSTDEEGEQHLFSGSLSDNSTESDPTTDDNGDVSDPTADKTDTGDPLSCSEKDGIGEEDCSGRFLSGTLVVHKFSSLRGYGCNGFRFGRGGGISIAFPVLQLRSAYITRQPKSEMLFTNSVGKKPHRNSLDGYHNE